MNEEIKEILDNPKILMLSYGNYISLDDYVKLKDCITNLQEEVNKLTAESTEWESKCYDLQKENKIQKEKIEHLLIDLRGESEYKQRNEIMEKYLELIYDLGYDYDGFNDADNLKGLIDEMCRLASLGRVCNATEPIYVDDKGMKANILGEIILKGDKDE